MTDSQEQKPVKTDDKVSSVNWWRLRAAGDIGFLKFSYLVLIAAPLLGKHQEILDSLQIEWWYLGIIYVANFSLALANILYDAACPTIVKKFASPNELYERMLTIRELAARAYPNDGFDATLAHCTAAYRMACDSRRVAAWACFTFFFVSALGFAAILGLRTYWVFGGSAL